MNYCLTPIRRIDDLKFNINLFKVFCSPSYRLGQVEYYFAKTQDKKKLTQHIKANIKRFCNLPFNTPNQTLKLLVGDF